MKQKVDVKVEAWHTVEDILKQYGHLGEILARTTPEMGAAARAILIANILDTCVRNYYDDDAVAMFQALEEADKGGHSGIPMRKRMEALYWALPMRRPYGNADGSEPAFVKLRLFICRRLIAEWVPQITAASANAFRRIIAMGWPLPKVQQQRLGESGIEMQARGRDVSMGERNGILAIIRDHLETFGDYQQHTADPDAVFTPWLKAPLVPEDLCRVLVVARAKVGGKGLAERDTRFGAILEGIPESGLELLSGTAQRMRDAAAALDEVLKDLQERIQQGHPRHTYLSDHLKRAYAYSFSGESTINVRIGPLGVRHDDLYVMAISAIAKALLAGHLKGFTVNLEVRGWPQGDEVHKTVPVLTRSWENV